MMSTLIITVNYKDSKPTEELIESIINCKISTTLKIVIIDNESSEDSLLALNMIKKRTNLDIEIICSRDNTYYWGGINLGIKKYINAKKKYNWIIACNNDIEFKDNSFFEKLNNLKRDSYAIIAPQIISSLTNKDLNPFMLKPISFIHDIYYSLYYLNYFTSKIIHKIGRFIKLIKRQSAMKNSSNYQIYAGHGSCIIFNKDFFSNGGILDTDFTMYGEEISTAEIAKKVNSRIYYIPSLSINHNEHQSTRKTSLKDNFLHSKQTYFYLKKKYRS
jgi:GT2 family glycosyltransferase